MGVFSLHQWQSGVQPTGAARLIVKTLERVLLVERLNGILSRSDAAALDVVVEAERNTRPIQLPSNFHVAEDSRCNIFYANHPLGGADVVAALKLMLMTVGRFRILASHVVTAPPCLRFEIVPIDTSGHDRALNARSLLRVMRGLGREYRNLFIFPAGRCSRLSPRLSVVTDPKWSETPAVLANKTGADLVPVWFSGRNSLLFYMLCFIPARAARLMLPREFFRKRTAPLVCRVGIPIKARYLVFFGSEAMVALRAASYVLEHRIGELPAPAARPPIAAAVGDRDRRNASQPTRVTVNLSGGRTVDRAEIMALRQACFGRDVWTAADDSALHLTAHENGRFVGYYRIFDWGNPGSMPAHSPIHAAFSVNLAAPNRPRILEFGRFCISGAADVSKTARGLWRGLRDLASTLDDRVLALGIISLGDANPVLAEAQFEFARRLSPCPVATAFQARKPIVPPSPHHHFEASRIIYDPPPKVADLPSIMKIYLSLGARFGASGLSTQLGCRPGVLCSVTPQELRLRR